jgi:hypothetical protein
VADVVADVLNEAPLYYPQITQIHADFWDFLKIIFWFHVD